MPLLPEDWIPVSERLPGEDGTYPVVVENRHAPHDHRATHSLFDADYGGMGAFWHCEAFSGYAVTHWLHPLPLPPRNAQAARD